MKLGLPSWLRRGANARAALEAAGQPPAPPSDSPLARPRRRRWPWSTAVGTLVIALFWGVGFYWSREPAVLWVVAETPAGERAVTGYSTVHTLLDVVDWLLDKPGGYLSNDVFYEARGTAWALLLFLRTAQFDFERTLEDKNAVVSLRQIIRELEEGLAPIRSPMILNGQGFGMFPNHSLVLASYLSRAHSAVADLRRLLEQG